MRAATGWLLLCLLLAGCRTSGTVQQELAHLRERVSTLEAENAHLRGQTSLLEYERTQLREQVNQLSAEEARLRAAQASNSVEGAAAVGKYLVVMPREVYPGAWVSVYVRNIPTRLLPNTAVALRGPNGQQLEQVSNLSLANVFLLTIPRDAPPGPYELVLGERGLPEGARPDDAVAVTVLAP